LSTSNSTIGNYLAIVRLDDEHQLHLCAAFHAATPHFEALCAKTFDYLRWAEGNTYAVITMDAIPTFEDDSAILEIDIETLSAYYFIEGMWTTGGTVHEYVNAARAPWTPMTSLDSSNYVKVYEPCVGIAESPAH
jgi:hypothetical protein